MKHEETVPGCICNAPGMMSSPAEYLIQCSQFTLRERVAMLGFTHMKPLPAQVSVPGKTACGVAPLKMLSYLVDCLVLSCLILHHVAIRFSKLCYCIV